MKRLEARVAVITGAASGIGRVTAARLDTEGAVAVVTDVQDALGEESAAEISSSGGKASFVHHDVTSEAEWQAVVERVLAITAGSTSSSTTPAWATWRRSRRPRWRTTSARSPSTKRVSSSG